MPTVNPATLPSPSPQFVDATGAPASGYQLFVYLAGSVSTKTNSYTDSTGTVANTNPIILNSLGRPATQIWIPAGVKVKYVLASPTDTDPPTSGTTLGDQLSGINDTTVSINEWVSGPAPTFINATSFSLVGDQTSTFAVGRRVQCTVTAGTVYGRITASSFAAVTTVTVVCDPSQALDSGLTAVSYGLLSSTAHPSIPWISVAADTVSTVASAGTVNLDNNGKDYQFISGTTTITAITLAQGKECTVEFQGALTLTNGASLILPGGANITTAAGDTAIFRGEAAGVVRCIAYTFAGNRQSAQNKNLPFVLAKSGTAVSAPVDTTEDTLATITVPANAIGSNGQIRFTINFACTNNANAKTVRLRYSGGAGTVVSSTTLTSSGGGLLTGAIANTNATNAQNNNSVLLRSDNTFQNSIQNTSAIDTTAATSIVITGQKAVAGDTVTMTNYLFELLSDGT